MDLNNLRSDLQACRVCLATDIKLISLQDLNLKRMYSEFSGVPIMASDGLPQHICVFCCAMLKKSSKFRKKCEAAYYLLLQHFLEKKNLTSSYVNTIDRSHLRMTMSTTAAIHCNCIPDTLFSIGVEELKEENETELTADECLTFEDELNETKPTLVGEPKFNINQDVSIDNRNSGKSNRCLPSTVLLDKTRPYECEFCHVRFKDTSTRYQHLVRHRQKLVCRQCGQVVRDMTTAREHYKSHSGVGFDCEHCGKKFDKYGSRINHIRIHHGNVSCDICHMKFTGELGLRGHKARAHLELFKCPSCLVQFHNPNALRRHAEATENGCGPHIRPCTQCGDSFYDDLQLKEHMFAMHLYDKNARREDYCNPHKTTIRRRRGEKQAPLICEMCGKEFKFEYALRDHKQRVHSEETPFVCDYCNKAFKSRPQIQFHISNVHSGRRYSCPHCSKAFRQAGHLAAHKLTHSTEKNFSCNICEIRFKHFSSMREHERIIHEGKPARKRGRKVKK